MSSDNSEYLFLLNRVKHLVRSNPMSPPKWSISKPYPQCKCSYPMIVYRNVHGHAEDCPVAIAWNTNYKNKKVEVTAEPVPEELDCAYCDTPKEKEKTNCKNCSAPYGRKK